MITGVVLRDLASHFAPRRIEWFFGFNVFALGLKLLLSVPDTFHSVRHIYDLMASMASENTWGFGLLAVGVVRLGALVLNGSLPAFAPYSPLARAVTSFLCAGAWLALTIGYAVGNASGLGMIYFGAAFLFELSITWEVGRDGGEALTLLLHHGSPARGGSHGSRSRRVA